MDSKDKEAVVHLTFKFCIDICLRGLRKGTINLLGQVFCRPSW